VDRIRKYCWRRAFTTSHTGVAPFVSRRAAGRDGWRARDRGGRRLIGAAARDRVTPELLTIATGCAGGLAAIDVVYVARRRIAPTYLADAAIQIALLAGQAREWTRPTDG